MKKTVEYLRADVVNSNGYYFPLKTLKEFEKEHKDDVIPVIDNIPNDFDIIQFSILANREILPDYREIQNEYESGKHFIECKKGYWSNCGLALSRKGMKYFIDAIDKEFLAADIVAFEDTNKIYFFGKNNIKSGLKHYIPTVPLVYLNDLGDSKIQETSKAELYEYYTHIDKQFYNILHNVK